MFLITSIAFLAASMSLMTADVTGATADRPVGTPYALGMQSWRLIKLRGIIPPCRWAYQIARARVHADTAVLWRRMQLRESKPWPSAAGARCCLAGAPGDFSLLRDRDKAGDFQTLEGQVGTHSSWRCLWKIPPQTTGMLVTTDLEDAVSVGVLLLLKAFRGTITKPNPTPCILAIPALSPTHINSEETTKFRNSDNLWRGLYPFATLLNVSK